jgi:hypothetical protein
MFSASVGYLLQTEISIPECNADISLVFSFVMVVAAIGTLGCVVTRILGVVGLGSDSV